MTQMSQAGPAAAAMPAFQEACSPRHGRHLLATQDLKPGQVVLNQQPYAAVLYDDQVSLRCDWCFNMAPLGTCLMRCTRSKLAHYCSKEHQRLAWKAYYRQESASLLGCAPKVPPATVRLAARVLWRKQSEMQSRHVSPTDTVSSSNEWLQQQQAGGSYADVQALLSHWEDLDDVRKLQYAQMAVLTREFMQQRQQQQQATENSVQAAAEVTPLESAPDVREVALLLARFACNNHTICDDELRPIGVGLYPLGALVNHHCRPSCVQTFEGRCIVFRSLGSLAAGHQLTISYVEVAATRQERRRQLLQQYFFDIDAAQHSAATQQDSSSTQHSNDVQQQEKQQQQQQHDRDPLESSAVAAACLTDGMQQGGLERMQVQVRLPDKQQSSGTARISALSNLRQQRLPLELKLWTAGSEPAALQSSSSDPSHCNLQHKFGATDTVSQPPFPLDASDSQLCRMLLLSPGQSCAPAQDNSSSSRPPVVLPGGMCLLPELLTAKAHQQAPCAAAQAASPAAQMLTDLFQDLEVSITTADDAVDGEVSAEAGVLQEVKDVHPGTKGSKGQHRQTPLEAVQWGAWEQAVLTLLQEQQQQKQQQGQQGCLHPDTTTGRVHQEPQSQQPDGLRQALVMAAAGRLLYVWHLQQQAERCIQAGCPAEAVQQCQAALEAADGQGPAPVVCTSVQHVATADGHALPADMLEPSSVTQGYDGAVCLHDGAVCLQQPAGIGTTEGLPAGTNEGLPAGLQVALGPQHILRIRVLASLLCAAVQDSKWQLALQAARQLLPPYVMVYPKVWPNLGLHYALLAKLELLLEQPAAAARAAEAAAGILHITHGSNASVLREVHQIHYDAQQELSLKACGAG